MYVRRSTCITAAAEGGGQTEEEAEGGGQTEWMPVNVFAI